MCTWVAATPLLLPSCLCSAFRSSYLQARGRAADRGLRLVSRCPVADLLLRCIPPSHRHEGGQARCGLRLVILEALLRTEPSFMLPPWLMRAFRVSVPDGLAASAVLVIGGCLEREPEECSADECAASSFWHSCFFFQFAPQPCPFHSSPQPPLATAPVAAAPAAPSSNADLAGALRVLMRHNRLADAAELAAAHLQAALPSVPSVGMARTSQVRCGCLACGLGLWVAIQCCRRCTCEVCASEHTAP